MCPLARASSTILIAVLVLILPGCSLLAVRPDRSARAVGDCRTPAVAPVIDGLLAPSEPIPGAPAAVRTPCDPTRPSSRFTGPCFLDLAPSAPHPGRTITLNVLEAAAATYGALKVTACKEARRKLAIPSTELAAAPPLDLALLQRR
jgi:hypothetical protein